VLIDRSVRPQGTLGNRDEEVTMSIASNAATALLRSLRAVRRFAPRPVPEPVLLEILEVGRWTGSSKNSQPWEIVVVRNPSTLAALAGLGRYAGHLAGAPAALVLVMESSDAAFDAGRLAQNLMLAAWAHGVGSCIASIYPAENERLAKQILGVPADRSVETAIALGYPADEHARRVTSAPADVRAVVPLGRKPLTAIVSWERYGEHSPALGGSAQATGSGA
jgi:nitroreductase